jgi:hypothetical protein
MSPGVMAATKASKRASSNLLPLHSQSTWAGSSPLAACAAGPLLPP